MDFQSYWERFQNHERRNLMIAGLLLLTLAVAGFLTLEVNVEERDYDLKLDQQLTHGDNPNKTLVVFSDYRCGHCRGFYQSTFPKLDEEFNFTIKHVNLPVVEPIQNSIVLGKASECAYDEQGDEAWSYHMDIMTEEFSNTTEVVEMYSGNQTQLQACIEDTNNTATEYLQQDINSAMERGYRSTPTILYNGEQVNASYSSLRQTLQE